MSGDLERARKDIADWLNGNIEDMRFRYAEEAVKHIEALVRALISEPSHASGEGEVEVLAAFGYLQEARTYNNNGSGGFKHEDGTIGWATNRVRQELATLRQSLAEVTRERDEALGRSQVDRRLRDQAMTDAGEFLTRLEPAEAEAARLRAAVEETKGDLGDVLTNDLCDSEDDVTWKIRNAFIRLTAALSGPEQKEGGGSDNPKSGHEAEGRAGENIAPPARESHPVPAQAIEVHGMRVCYECSTPLTGPDCPQCNPVPPPSVLRGLVEALKRLEQAEVNYRMTHDLHGDGDAETGRAWDTMRRSGDLAREALTAARPYLGGT